MKLTALTSLFGAAALLASATTSAAIITEWQVDVDTIFDISSVHWTGGTGTVVNNQSLRWGTSTGQGRSGLDITDSPASTTVYTNGAAVPNVSVTHLNRPITGASLHDVTILSTLTLTPLSPAGAGLPPETMTFMINFMETPNADNPCANGTTNYTGVNVNGCADIFVIDKDALNFPFMYDSVQYYISFFEASNALLSLSQKSCEATGASYPCLGFLTQEGKDNTFQFAAMITTEEVEIEIPDEPDEPGTIPEPGTLGLLGIALVGMGLARRRRTA